MRLNKNIQLFSLIIFATIVGSQTNALAQLPNGWKAHDLKRPQPKVVTPGATSADAPSDAVVLLGSEKLTGWSDSKGRPTKWEYADGVLKSVKKAGAIFSVEKFGDCQIHVEFATPETPKGKGQARGNSGVFFFGAKYEVQVLDNFENETYPDGTVGGIYGQHAPLVNACRGPGQWQTYDIVFRRPRFDDAGELKSPARLTVMLNGVLVQDAAECYGPTEWLQHGDYTQGPKEQRISLQDHGNPVRYRNIWVRRLAETPPTPPTPRATIELSETQTANYPGIYGKFEVKNVDGKLFLKRSGKLFGLQVHSTTEMSFEKTAGSLVFQLDEQGRATSAKGSMDAIGKFKGERK